MAIRAADRWQAAARVEDDTPEAPTFALRLASKNGNFVVAELLLKRGAIMSRVEERTDGDTPLMLAARKGPLLPAHGAFRASQFLSTCFLFRVVQSGVPAVCGSLFGVLICDKPTPGSSGHADIVRLLAEYGADVNRPRVDGGGETPLVVACQLGKAGVVRALLEKGADAKRATLKEGTTPMLAASAGGFLPCVEALLEYYYDPSTPDAAGTTPLAAACEHGHADVVAVLLAGGADRDKCGPAGTPLAVALKKGHSECAALLRA